MSFKSNPSSLPMVASRDSYEPRVIHLCHRFDSDETMNRKDIQVVVIEHVARDLARELLISDAIEVEEEKDIERMQTKHHFTVRVLVPTK